jgi:hypothetical protein
MINENLTELPKYWYCELTDESRDTLNNWRKNIIKYSDTNCPYKWITENGSGRKVGGEITFPQFKKWVLKEESKQDLYKTVVHCTTQEEFNFVYESWNKPCKNSSAIKEHGECCIYADRSGFNRLYLCKQIKCIILSFSDWCEQNGHKPDFMKVKEKQLTVDDLVEGEIYWTDKPNEYIFKASKNGKGYNGFIYKNYIFNNIKDETFKEWGILRKATPEEKQWLETCISLNKFVTLEESKRLSTNNVEEKKEDIPEYVECIKIWQGHFGNSVVGKVYSIYNSISEFSKHTLKEILERKALTTHWEEYFKPSTKAAAIEYNVDERTTGKIINGDSFIHITNKLEHQQPIIYKKSKNKLKLITVNI